MATHASRGKEITDARSGPPGAGRCSSIIVSVFTVCVSCPLCMAACSARVAPARLSLPISRMFCAGPSRSAPVGAGTAAPCGTLPVKPRNDAHA